MTTRFAVTVGLLILVFTVAAEGAEAIGSVVSAKGQCWAVRQNGTSRKLSIKSPIFLNDRVVTKDGSGIQIMLNDDSVISQGEKSELVIDEYVYKPKEKEGKSAIRAIKGLFRMVTGKITDLNPERFKVKTRMATVGIRGCEVGFKLQAKREDIYIIHLPKGKSILIKRNALASEIVADTRAGMDDILTIVRQGVVVSIEEGGSLQKRDMTTQEILELMSSVFEVTDAVDDSTEDKHQAEHAANLPPDDQGDPGGGKGRPYTSPPGVALVANGGAPFTQWAWGLYADGSVFYDGNAELPSTLLTQAEYDAVRNAAYPTGGYNLTGGALGGAFSESQAQVYHAGSGETLVFESAVPFGINAFNVNIGGGGAVPTWSGDFALSNPDDATDNLAFTADGTIGNDGHLQLGNVPNYQLNVNGDSFNQTTLTSRDFGGELLTDGISPVSGAAGEYHFEHNDGSRVDGAWGTDLK